MVIPYPVPAPPCPVRCDHPLAGLWGPVKELTPLLLPLPRSSQALSPCPRGAHWPRGTFPFQTHPSDLEGAGGLLAPPGETSPGRLLCDQPVHQAGHVVARTLLALPTEQQGRGWPCGLLHPAGADSLLCTWSPPVTRSSPDLDLSLQQGPKPSTHQYRLFLRARRLGVAACPPCVLATWEYPGAREWNVRSCVT